MKENEFILSDEQIIIRNLVENFYKQKPLPNTAACFKMKMIAAIDYCKEKKIVLPVYDQFRKDWEKRLSEGPNA